MHAVFGIFIVFKVLYWIFIDSISNLLDFGFSMDGFPISIWCKSEIEGILDKALRLRAPISLFHSKALL